MQIYLLFHLVSFFFSFHFFSFGFGLFCDIFEMIFTFNLWASVADGQFYLLADLGVFLMLISLSVLKVFLIFH